MFVTCFHLIWVLFQRTLFLYSIGIDLVGATAARIIVSSVVVIEITIIGIIVTRSNTIYVILVMRTNVTVGNNITATVYVIVASNVVTAVSGNKIVIVVIRERLLYLFCIWYFSLFLIFLYTKPVLFSGISNVIWYVLGNHFFSKNETTLFFWLILSSWW